MNNLYRFFFLFLAVLICCSCEKLPLDPQIPYGLLLKAKDFLTFCIFLADQEKPYYNHIAQRYYYALLSMASITYQWHKGHGVKYEVVKHTEVWKIMPDEAKTYGQQLKELRKECDYYYDVESRDNNHYKQELLSLMNNSEKALNQLENKAREDSSKFFGERVTSDKIKPDDCETLLVDIKKLHIDFKEKMNKDSDSCKKRGEG